VFVFVFVVVVVDTYLLFPNSDKTGTLTTANMSIIPERIYAAEGFTEEDVILYAYLCSNADKKDDPIDKAIVRAFLETENSARKDEYKQFEIIGFNPNVKRVVAFVTHGEETITIAKGLPAKLVDTSSGGADDHEFQWKVQNADDPSFLNEVSQVDTGLSKSGYKTIGISICRGNAREMANPVWVFAGLVPMLDPPRHDTAATIASLHHANISVKMITGDHVNVGKETARLIGLGQDIRSGEEVRNAPPEEKKKMIWEADGFAAVLPSDKREAVLTLRNEFGVVTGMTGDVSACHTLGFKHFGVYGMSSHASFCMPFYVGCERRPCSFSCAGRHCSARRH
jgi:H+-transporting ATPase